MRCIVATGTPQLFRVSRPTIYTTPTVNQTRPPVGTVDPGQITITGTAFGATKGTLLLNGTAVAAANVTAWSDSSIRFTLPATQTPGPYNLQVRTAAGRTTVNGITVHDIARVTTGGTTTTYNPTLIEVGPGKAFATIQAGLNRAAQISPGTTALVVVYPNTVDTYNPDGAYYENVIMHSPVKLQGVGPGGSADGTTRHRHRHRRVELQPRR